MPVGKSRKDKSIDDYLRNYLLTGKAEGQIVEQDFSDERKKADALDFISAGSKALTGLGTLGGVTPQSTTPGLAQNLKKNQSDLMNRQEMRKSSLAPAVLSYLARTREKELTPEERDLMSARTDKFRADAEAIKSGRGPGGGNDLKRANDLLRYQINAQRLQEMKNPRPKPPTMGEREKRGLFKMGVKAEQQFQDAIKKGKQEGWDPTKAEQISNWRSDFIPDAIENKFRYESAIEAKAAMDSWGDSFLRDESGAAIPVDERTQYYMIYYPQKGDTPQAIKNKRQLRAMKMRLALEAGTPFGSNSPQEEVQKLEQLSSGNQLDQGGDVEKELEKIRQRKEQLKKELGIQ